jgi:hypothetical protein
MRSQTAQGGFGVRVPQLSLVALWELQRLSIFHA